MRRMNVGRMNVGRLAVPAIGLIAFGLVWELAVRVFEVPRFALRPPSGIIATLADAPTFYWTNALVTGRHMAVGLVASLVAALAVGSVMAASRWIDEAVQPVLVLILVTPWVAYVTSVVIWLDFGEAPILFMVAFTAFPVFTFGVVGGMRSADAAAREVFASVNAGRWDVLWRLRLPSALPSIFTTTRLALGLGLAAAYFSEGAALSNDGLGAVGKRATAFNDGDTLWATVVTTALLGIVGLMAIAAAERVLLRWHVSQR